MSTDTSTESTGEAEATTAPPAADQQGQGTNTPPAPAEPAQDQQEGAQQGEQADPWADPAAARAEIERLRNENKRDRTAGKQAAADEARQELIKMLAGDDEGEDTPTDPAKLAEQIAEQRNTAQAATEGQQAAERKLAVVMAAIAEGADHEALLDSNNFLTTVNGLDPNTDGEKITAAVKDAVSNNQRFKGTRAVPGSRADTSGGTGEGAITQEQFDGMSYNDKAELFRSNPNQYRQLAG